MNRPPSRPTCPRCRGHLRLAGDHYGHYLSCLLCGFVRELLTSAPLDLPTAAIQTMTTAR